MDQQIQKIEPNYKKIYSDIIYKKFPDKFDSCNGILKKENLSTFDVIELEKRIFGLNDKNSEKSNQKYRSYNRTDILKMLTHQKNNRLNNTQLAFCFKLSRNTVAKWKKQFEVEIFTGNI